jgi:hypothetical protein
VLIISMITAQEKTPSRWRWARWWDRSLIERGEGQRIHR